MTQKQLDMVKELEGNVSRVAGASKSKEIMRGIETLKLGTNKIRLAEWVQGALARLDAL
nr:hypothetical protein [Candidatus Sigynarchaeota archaeon]